MTQTSGAAGAARTPTAIDALAERHVAELLRLRPEETTAMGFAGGETEYGDFSPAGLRALDELNARTLAELAGLEGEHFSAVVVSAPTPEQVEKAQAEDRLPYGEVQLEDPPVLGRYEGHAKAGQAVTVELVSADLESRTVLFRIVEQAAE